MSLSPSSNTTEMIKTAKDSLRSELTVAQTYSRIADITKDKELSEKLHQVAKNEKQHAEFWKKALLRRGEDPENITANSWKVTVVVFIYRLLGAGLLIKILESGERQSIQRYLTITNRGDLQEDELNSLIQFLRAELAHEEMFRQYVVRFRFFIRRIDIIFTQTSGGLVVVLSTVIGFSQLYTDSNTLGLICLFVGIISAATTAVEFYFFERTGRRIKEDILAKISVTYSHMPEAYRDRAKKYLKLREYSEELIDLMVGEAVEKGILDKIIAEEEYGIKEELNNPLQSAFLAGTFRIFSILIPLVPFFFGLTIAYAIFGSIFITVVLVSVSGSLVAIAADVSVKDKISELLLGLFVMVTLTYLLGNAVSYILGIKA